jgi:tRNA (adenine22-N1)-methyltransferase
MKLSKRMEALIRLLPEGCVAADVGCDHGFVSIELVQRGICPRVIAMDVRSGPLSRAEEHIREAGLEDSIETRLGDGFGALKPGEADGCIIAGMGGRMIQKILTEGRNLALDMKALVLQPQSEIPEFREFLRENGFRILKSDVVYEDGKYYFPMLVAPGEEEILPVEEQELADRFGRDLLCPGSPLEDYLNRHRKNLTKLLTDIRDRGIRDEARLAELEHDLGLTEKALERLSIHS